jgi:ribosomal protein S18 acetylase RimI-like enzyme
LGPDEAHVLDRVRAGTFDNPIDPTQAWAFLSTGLNVLVVAIQAGEVVGFASGTVLLHPDKPPAFFVNEVGVHDSVQRQGIASRLMERLLDIVRDRGVRGIWLATELDNAAARGLYRKIGARESEGFVVYDWDDTDL